MKKKLFNVVRVLITACLLFILVVPASRFIAPAFPLVNLSGLPGILRRADKLLLFFALLANLAGICVIALRWKTVLRRENLPYGLLWRLTLIGIFFNNFLPTGAGGDVVKGYYFLKERRRKLNLGISIVIDRMLGTFSIMSLGFIAVMVRFPLLSPAAAWAVVAFFLAILFFFLFAAWPVPVRLFGRAAARLTRRKESPESLRSVYYGFHNYINDASSWTRALSVSYLSQFLGILAVYFVAAGIGTPLTALELMVAIPLVWSFSMVPSLGGLGVREAGYLFFFQARMGREGAFALALIMLCLTLFNSLIGGIIYFYGGGQWRRREET